MASAANTANLHQLAKELVPRINGKVNIAWLLQRLPIFVLSIESAYNVWGYLRLTGTNVLISIIGSIGFDAIYIGLVALSDQIREIVLDNSGKLAKGHIDFLFWCINVGAVAAAFLAGLLYHSGGSYSQVTAESFTRAILFPVLSLLYTLYFDRKAKRIKQQNETMLKQYPLFCEFCGRRYKEGEEKKLNGHKAQCTVRRQNTAP